MKKFLTIIAVLSATVATAHSADFTYDHNGSKMRLEVSGDTVRIFYQSPRNGLAREGVRQGTLLFNGKVNQGYLEGQSRIFSANCGEVDYYVYGDFKAGRTFQLKGAAPVLSQMSCRIVDNVYTGPNANLRFTAIGGNQQSKPKPQPAKSGCVKGVNSTLNVRMGPSSDYQKVGELNANSCGVELLGRCQSGWCVVKQGNIIGWTSMKYVQR